MDGWPVKPKPMRFALLFATSLLAGVAGGATAADTCAGKFAIDAAELDWSEEQGFRERFAAAAKKVCEWWGPSWTRGFEIEVDRLRGPSMALVPAWRGSRGSMIFRAPTVRRSASAIVHEITHVLAPNANRFLAEGLGVYAQEALGGQPAYPNFARDLHREAAKLAGNADIAALERYATPTRLRSDALDGREAYIVAGSFVRYLIETYGMERFRELYALTPLVVRARDPGDPARWQTVYGKPLAALAEGWRSALGKR